MDSDTGKLHVFFADLLVVEVYIILYRGYIMVATLCKCWNWIWIQGSSNFQSEMVCYNLKVCAKCLLRNLELSSSRDLNAVLPSHRHRDTNRVGTTSIALGVLFCNTLDAPCMTSYRLYIYIYNPFSIEQLNQEMCQRHQAQRVNMMFLLLLGLAFLN